MGWDGMDTGGTRQGQGRAPVGSAMVRGRVRVRSRTAAQSSVHRDRRALGGRLEDKLRLMTHDRSTGTDNRSKGTFDELFDMGFGLGQAHLLALRER